MPPTCVAPAGVLHASSLVGARSRHAVACAPAPRARGRALVVRPCASVRARWVIDVRYGHKAEAIALMQEWVQTIGSKAGFTAANTRLSSGAVGAPESRLEVRQTGGRGRLGVAA